MSSDYTCRCGAYKFPHRFGGGKCTGMSVVHEHWFNFWGHSKHCKSCNCFKEDEITCDVVDGGESVINCEKLMDFVHTNDIKFKGLS